MNAPRHRLGWTEAVVPPFTNVYTTPILGHPISAGAPISPTAHHNGGMVTAPAAPPPPHPNMRVQQLVEQQIQEELRKNAKRAANRRSASTCRARKKVLVETMAEANERMRKRSRVLSLLPDMILAMRRDGVITYASENCRQFLKYTREEVEGCNIFDLVEAGCHERLRRLMEENLGAVSKEAIASALRFQGTTFEALLARSERAKEQGDSSFFSASGEPPRPPAAAAQASSGSPIRSGSWLPDSADCASTDGGESEVNSSGNVARGTASCGGTSRGSSGSGGSGAENAGTAAGERRLKSKSLPPLGPAVFSSRKNDAGGGTLKVGGTGAAAAVDGGVVTSVDRDLQSKINAFTNNQREICKLEIVRRDKKSDWYEVRSSMRLVWLKNKQEIVPVEVICSFQLMHGDGPAGSANSIVNRLQQAAAMVHRSLLTSNNVGDSSQSISGFSASAGSSVSASSVASSEGDDRANSCARSSSEYRGGVSSGSGDGSGVDNDEDDGGPQSRCHSTNGGTDDLNVIRPPKRAWGGDGAVGGVSRRSVGALEGLAEVAAAAAAEEAAAGGRMGGGCDGGVGGVNTAEVMSPTAQRLALSAKKMILLRHHGFDGSI